MVNKRSSLGLLGILLLCSATVLAQSDRTAGRSLDTVRPSLDQLKLESPLRVAASESVLHRSLRGAQGSQQVIVRLKSPAAGALNDGFASTIINQKLANRSEQAGFMARCEQIAPGARLLGRTQLVLNAVFIEVDAASLPALASDPAVLRIAPVIDYEMHLGETVPYIGASAVQDLGVDGSGIKLAVFDSGIDYTHANFGGGGTLADYEAAYGTDTSDPRNTTRDGLFPTAKVVEGYDFVGEAWPNGDLAPDEDPIDFEGHGTHVADISGGLGGVAPGVDLYAVKVCSAVSSSCSGVALIQGMEFAVDPNGDGDPSDAVDVINMSLGANYGQPFDDDLSAAVDNATALGVLTVASAGNSGDKPYVTGTPAAADTALSVAQTQVPSAALPFLTLNEVDYASVFQSWSVPPTGVISGPLQYGDGAGGNLNGCAPFAPGSLAGLVVLIDRGACNFTLKISNVSIGGGVAGIIGLVAPGAPFSGGDGGDRPIDIPGYMISQADSSAFKAQVGDEVTIDPAKGVPLVGQMVGSSSRGPRNFDNRIKPEIGAPGASVSAIAGTGSGEGPFGGTSGAAPMVAGSAALLLDAFDSPQGKKSKHSRKGKGWHHKPKGLSPTQVKGLLSTHAEINIATDPFAGLAPITRIGGGEVRVDRALAAGVAAWDAGTGQPVLSFGFKDVARDKVRMTRILKVKNLTDKKVKYAVAPTFRYDDDAANGAVEVKVSPRSLLVQPGATREVRVRMTIDGAALPGNFMNSGSVGADGTALTANEYDGYVVLDDGKNPMNVAWQVLPRQAAKVKPDERRFPAGGGTIALDNRGVGIAQNDPYSLLAVSSNLPRGGKGDQSPTPDIRAVGINTFPVSAGFCSGEDSFLWAFAVNTWERQQHVLPVISIISLDTNQDGTDDFDVFNADLGYPAISDGRQVTWVQDLTTGDLSAFFFAEHATNTGNTVLLICGEQIGLTGTDLLATNVDMTVQAFDYYFGGPGDIVEGLTVTPLGEQYFGVTDDIPGNDVGSIEIIDFGAFPGNSPELGVLLLTNGDRGTGARGGATEKTEALVIGVEGADLSPLRDKNKHDDDDDDDDD